MISTDGDVSERVRLKSHLNHIFTRDSRLDSRSKTHDSTQTLNKKLVGDHILLELTDEGLLTLDVADISPLRVHRLAARLLCDLFLQPLDLAAQVRDDVGVLGDVVGHVDQVLFHLQTK